MCKSSGQGLEHSTLVCPAAGRGLSQHPDSDTPVHSGPQTATPPERREGAEPE